MTNEVYLILDRKGVNRMSKRKPLIKRTEIGVRVRVNFDPKIFDRFTPTAELIVTDSQVIAPVTVQIDNPTADVKSDQ